MHFVNELGRIIGSRSPVRMGEREGFLRAAVMMVLKLGGQGYEILFIRRPLDKRDAFSGHIAFPGGKYIDADGDTLTTALRETLEETGLDIRTHGCVLGSLDDVNPVTPGVNHYVVTPYVTFLCRPHELKTNGEVEEVIWIPISHLKDERNFEARWVEKRGRMALDYVYRYGNIEIWGMTGRILHQFLSLAGHLF
ncbi:MAG: CoA pyrophosphatase [Candidatus Caldarchaeum sp.]